VNADTALMIIASSERVQEATGLDQQGLLRRFASAMECRLCPQRL